MIMSFYYPILSLFWLYKCIGVQRSNELLIKSTVPKTLLTSLTSQKAETGKGWNEANLQSTSLYGCIHLVLLFFHQADYGNITLTMYYFSLGVSIDHCTDFIIVY